MEELLKATGQTAFPVAVAAFLLVRMESRMEALTRAIGELQAILTRGCLLGGGPIREATGEAPPRSVRGEGR